LVYYGADGIAYELTNRLGGGGEGDIYTIKGDSNKVAKIFKKIDLQMSLKIRALSEAVQWSELIVKNAMLPLTTLFSDNTRSGECVGFVMNRLKCKELLLDVYNQPENRISIYNQACLAENICRLVDEIHKAGMVNGNHSIILGDFNPKNIFVDRRTGQVQLTDTDSFHVTVKYRNRVRELKCRALYKDLFFIPEILKACVSQNTSLENVQGETFTIYTDYFCMAYHVHKLLLGVEPYAGERVQSAIDSSDSVETAPSDAVLASAGNYVYTNVRSGYRIPSRFPDFSILTPQLQRLFRRAFQDGASDPKARPTAAEFAEALGEYISQLDYCHCNGWDHYLIHSYDKDYCEWCRVEHESGDRRVFFSQNVPYMTDQELLHSLELDLKKVFKAEIYYNLGIRSKKNDKIQARDYLLKAADMFRGDSQPGAIKRQDQIKEQLGKL